MAHAARFRWIEDRRSRRIATLIAVLWTISLMDLYFTLWAQRFTPFMELNPFADSLLSRHLLPSLILMKLVLTTVGTAIFWRLRNKKRAEVGLWIVVLIHLLLAVRWSNYTHDALANTAPPPVAADAPQT